MGTSCSCWAVLHYLCISCGLCTLSMWNVGGWQKENRDLTSAIGFLSITCPIFRIFMSGKRMCEVPDHDRFKIRRQIVYPKHITPEKRRNNFRSFRIIRPLSKAKKKQEQSVSPLLLFLSKDMHFQGVFGFSNKFPYPEMKKNIYVISGFLDLLGWMDRPVANEIPLNSSPSPTWCSSRW